MGRSPGPAHPLADVLSSPHDSLRNRYGPALAATMISDIVNGVGVRPSRNLFSFLPRHRLVLETYVRVFLI